jgi:uncharacterized membrane protein (DUF4010 family)
MMLSTLPADAQKFALVLLLSFLVGLEHEEHKGERADHYSFGGIRTFPLLGILGYAAALLSVGQPVVLGVGLLAIGALMVSSFLHKLKSDSTAGMTSEISGMLTYLLGAVVYQEHYWIATTLVVTGVLLLELKTGMELLAKRLPAEELLTFVKFLLLTAVIFPILPDVSLTRFQINPQHAWLIVVAISALSYGSYILQRRLGDRSAVISALLGGAYSSTITTIALAKQSRSQNRPHLYSGAILCASGAMYLHVAILVAIFSTPLRLHLTPILVGLGVLGIAAGLLWSRQSDSCGTKEPPGPLSRNPLEIRAALIFAALFVGMLALTHFVLQSMGTPGIYGLSVVTGVTNVDPFIMGLTQSAGTNTPTLTAAICILIATSSNNLIKGIYGWTLSDKETGKQSFFALLALSLLGIAALLPIVFGSLAA